MELSGWKKIESLGKDDHPLNQCTAGEVAIDNLARSCKALQRADALMMEGCIPILVDDGRLDNVGAGGGEREAPHPH